MSNHLNTIDSHCRTEPDDNKKIISINIGCEKIKFTHFRWMRAQWGRIKMFSMIYFDSTKARRDFSRERDFFRSFFILNSTKIEIDRLLMLADISFNFSHFSFFVRLMRSCVTRREISLLPPTLLIHFFTDLWLHFSTRQTSVRHSAKSTTISRSDFRTLKRTRKAGRTRFAIISAWMSVSLKFQEKVAANERETIGLWVSFVKFITELYS